MADDKNKQNTDKVESNAERDQVEGSMNNGTIGGSMGTIDSSNNDKAGTVGSEDDAGRKAEESAAANI